eukprot:m.159210 g.159210  ORF g.159210 m.159210 type:complete len:332 (+) comp9837_c0_seq1:19-1014(+)
MSRTLSLLALVVCAGATFNFLAVGDWGGTETSPYTTPGEIAAAVGMALQSTALNASFVLGLGDNFYHTGIQGDDTNFRFNATFDDVYKQSSLQIPWYLFAGNHDHLGNVTAQIAYSQLSRRWTFPSYYYSIDRAFTDAGTRRTVQIIMIDTVILAGNNDLNPDRFMAPPGPADVDAAETQWEWIEAQLAASTADYLWVAGHFPVWSACEHGPTDVLVSRLRPMLIKYKATGYLSGHDHCLEYIDDGAAPKYVLSGAGVECCYKSTNTDKCPKNSIKFIVANTQPAGGMKSGFVSFRLGAANMSVVYHNQDGTAIFTTPPMYPRAQEALPVA